MTGAELRQRLAANGITPTQFANRFADEVVTSRETWSQPMEPGEENRIRKSAVRTAKRWLSQKNADRHLKLITGNRALAARAAGVDERAFQPPRLTYRAHTNDSRLEELAESVGDALERLLRVEETLDDVQDRLRALEAGLEEHASGSRDR